MKTLKNGNKKIIITRTKLSDGYNYYLVIVNTSFLGLQFIDDSYKQVDNIYSLRTAIDTAKSLLN